MVGTAVEYVLLFEFSPSTFEKLWPISAVSYGIQYQYYTRTIYSIRHWYAALRGRMTTSYQVGETMPVQQYKMYIYTTAYSYHVSPGTGIIYAQCIANSIYTCNYKRVARSLARCHLLCLLFLELVIFFLMLFVLARWLVQRVRSWYEELTPAVFSLFSFYRHPRDFKSSTIPKGNLEV